MPGGCKEGIFVKIGGVVAEYNPFHNGHRYQLEALRQAGATHVVAVMSGNFVQRGEPALLDKWTRAEAALLSGADLVVELPLPYGAATAERFAFGAVSLLDGLGCVELLGFGCESGQVESLWRGAEAVEDPAVYEAVREKMAGGRPFAAAREEAVWERYGDAADCLRQPNDILAVEYLRKLRQLGSTIQPVAVRRQGAGHDSPEAGEGFASASALRGRWAGGLAQLSPYLPPQTLPLYHRAQGEGRVVDRERWQWMELSGLRARTQEELSLGADLSEGLENRLYAATRQAGTLEELYDLCKTKRYSHARVRRVALAAFLGVDGELCRLPPPYLRVLGFNGRGREILAGKTARLPLSHSLARLEQLGGDSARFARLEARAGDQYALALKTPRPCGWEYTQKPVILR